MLIWILGICIIIMLFLWAIVAGTRKEDNYEEQMYAIEQWERKKRND